MGRCGWSRVALAFLALWVPYFFRDPERDRRSAARRSCVAPADGRLQAIADVDEPTFVHGRATRISIFMNVFDVHVNRYPITGTVVYRHYNPGKFLNAAMEKASLENEQSSIGIESTGGRYRLLVRQIAGLIARRIVTYGAVRRPASSRAPGWALFDSDLASMSLCRPAAPSKSKPANRSSRGPPCWAELP